MNFYPSLKTGRHDLIIIQKQIHGFKYAKTKKALL